ncbi:MAG: hypothetical protein WBR13_02590 [Allosphingosinicella sp.]
MTEKEDGPTADPGGVSKPDEEVRRRDPEGPAGREEAKDEEPRAVGRDRSEAAIDLDTAHDRAS